MTSPWTWMSEHAASRAGKSGSAGWLLGPLAVAASAAILLPSGTSLGAPNRYALIIAVQDYPDAEKLDPLEGTNGDADELCRVLQRNGFHKDNIVLVYDKATSADRKPRKVNILKNLNDLLARTKEGDMVLVMTTGHGMVIGRQSYFCPSDTSEESAGIRNLIPVTDIATSISKSAATHKLLIVDACRNENSDAGSFVEPLKTPPEGLWVMSSCSEGQYSYVSPYLKDDEPHAVFSYFLSKGLDEDADRAGNGNQDRRVSIFELFSYAYSRTLEHALEMGGRQTPELFGGSAVAFSVSVFGERPTIRTTDPELARKQTAKAIADQAGELLEASNSDWDDVCATSEGHPSEADVQRHVDLMSFVVGNYLNRALKLDRDCREARQYLAAVYRECGKYREAAQQYAEIGEQLDLFVWADAKTLEDHAEREANQKEKTKPEIRLLPSANHNGPPIETMVTVDSKIRVKKVAVNSRREWLLVTAVNDTPLAQEAWIGRKNVCWYHQAVDAYLPNSRMGRSGGVSANHVAGNLVTRYPNIYARYVRVKQGLENVDRILNFAGIGGISGYLPNWGGQNPIRSAIPNWHIPVVNTGVHDILGGSDLSQIRALNSMAANRDSSRQAEKFDSLTLVDDKQVAIDRTPWEADGETESVP